MVIAWRKTSDDQSELGGGDGSSSDDGRRRIGARTSFRPDVESLSAAGQSRGRHARTTRASRDYEPPNGFGKEL